MRQLVQALEWALEQVDEDLADSGGQAAAYAGALGKLEARVEHAIRVVQER